MSPAVSALEFISESGYLEGEERAETRHEYLNGMVYSSVRDLAGGTRQHATVVINVAAAMHAALRGGPCRAYVENMKLRTRRGEDMRFYYPDVMVVRQPSKSDLWEDSPSVLVEVLSEGTERTDMVEKRGAYLAIPSLAAYVLLDSRRVEALVLRRSEGGWKQEILRDAAGVIELPEIGCRLPLAAAYEGVL